MTGSFYVYGGVATGVEAEAGVFRFDAGSCTWEEVPVAQSYARSSHASVLTPAGLLVQGGLDGV